MKYVAILCMVVVIAISPAWASAECKVEAWRAYSLTPDTLMLEGSATCEKGWIIVRLYSGDGDSAKFIGVARGYIKGYAFQLMASSVSKPPVLTIKYNIDP